MAALKPPSRKKRSPRTDSESSLDSTLPIFVPTMQPTLVNEAPEGGDWLHEIKYDGYRTQIAIGGGQIRAYTRNGHDWSEKYQPILRDAVQLDCRSALIDGEIVVQDAAGVTDFGQLPDAIRNRPQDLIFYAFDLLHLDGEDLRKAPLEERRAKLRWLIGRGVGRLHMSDEFDGDGKAFFELVDRHGLEGIVSKRKGSRYVSGDTKSWLKTKCWHTDTFDVIGVEKDKTGVPYALLADKTGYRGAAFVGLPGQLRERFWRFIESKPLSASPVAGIKKKANWIAPGMRAQVRFLRGSDKLRHAVIQKIEIAD